MSLSCPNPYAIVEIVVASTVETYETGRSIVLFADDDEVVEAESLPSDCFDVERFVNLDSVPPPSF